ncbi:hypothetical protein EYZ11_009683 [Aspergillus tanneri]|nr:hypothetical protein EYZ11_009683 [Aspergillus tanneri]
MYLTGDVPSPTGRKTRSEEEQCRLYYYQFNLSDQCNNITHEWALSAIWFELPVVPKSKSMRNARFVYGYSTAQASFGDLTLQALKADCLVKVNAGALIEKGKKESPVRVMGCVDKRSISEIITSADPNDPIKVFRMPPGCYGAECSFVSREGALDEDDGWLLTFVFDESQLQKVSREQFSELWIINAKDMQSVVARVQIPHRVPYGFHGSWFSESDLRSQRALDSTSRGKD